MKVLSNVLFHFLPSLFTAMKEGNETTQLHCASCYNHLARIHSKDLRITLSRSEAIHATLSIIPASSIVGGAIIEEEEEDVAESWNKKSLRLRSYRRALSGLRVIAEAAMDSNAEGKGKSRSGGAGTAFRRDILHAGLLVRTGVLLKEPPPGESENWATAHDFFTAVEETGRLLKSLTGGGLTQNTKDQLLSSGIIAAMFRSLVNALNVARTRSMDASDLTPAVLASLPPPSICIIAMKAASMVLSSLRAFLRHDDVRGEVSSAVEIASIARGLASVPFTTAGVVAKEEYSKAMRERERELARDMMREWAFVQEQAAALILTFSIDARLRRILVEDQVVWSTLVDALRRGDARKSRSEKLRRHSAGIIANLCGNADMCEDIVQRCWEEAKNVGKKREGLIVALEEALDDNSDGLREAAAGALRNLSVNKNSIPILLRSEVTPNLIKILGAAKTAVTTSVRSQAAVALRNISVEEEGKEALVRGGCVQTIGRALFKGELRGKVGKAARAETAVMSREEEKEMAAEDALRLQCLVILRNTSITKAGKRELLAGGSLSALQLLLPSDRPAMESDGDGSGEKKGGRHGKDRGGSYEDERFGHEVPVLKVGELGASDLRMIEQVTGIVRNMAADKVAKKEMIGMPGILRRVVRLLTLELARSHKLKTEVERVLEQAAGALRNLCTSRAASSIAVSAGLVRISVSLLSSPHPLPSRLLEQLTGLVRNLASPPLPPLPADDEGAEMGSDVEEDGVKTDFRPMLVSEGVVPLLMQIVHAGTAPAKVQQQAGLALKYLSDAVSLL
uniref:Vacuolar protein 8 n=1 Tax=Palpitomonas bilix TaxID=652834 RepID=A0A7S3CZ40_9EUKA